MSRKDYVKIAAIIKSMGACGERTTMVAKFERMLSEDNPNFDSERFTNACGEGEPKDETEKALDTLRGAERWPV